MKSIFTKIIERELPAYIVAEDEKHIAFLDITPLAKGHTLVVPKKEINYYFDIEDDLMYSLNIFSKKVAKAIEKTIECARIGVSIIGLEVPHTHIHLVPINHVEDINFSRPRLTFSAEEMQKIAKYIAENF